MVIGRTTYDVRLFLAAGRIEDDTSQSREWKACDAVDSDRTPGRISSASAMVALLDDTRLFIGGDVGRHESHADAREA